MMDKRIAYLIIAAGIIAILIGLLADTIGLGATESTFGTYQIIAVVAGVVLVLVGAYLGFMRGPRQPVA